MHTAAEPSTINKQAMNVQRRIEKREPVNNASLSACRQCDFQWLPERNARRFFHSGVCRPPKASYLQSALTMSYSRQAFAFSTGPRWGPLGMRLKP